MLLCLGSPSQATTRGLSAALHPAGPNAIAEAAQMHSAEWTRYVHLGEWRLVSAARRNVVGFISAGPTVFWNVEKK